VKVEATRCWIEPALVQNSEPAEGAALLGDALELEVLDPAAELFSSDPLHPESTTATAATDNALRHMVGIRRMGRG
jgi:hypothetical protein